MMAKGSDVTEKKDSDFETKKTEDNGAVVRKISFPKILAGQYAEKFSIYIDKNGDKAIVPPGWTVSGVEKQNTIWGKNVGLVIYNIPKEKVNTINWKDNQEIDALQQEYDQFVWVPVKLLPANGTLNGIKFNKKFGRRNYGIAEFSKQEFHEKITEQMLNQIKSIKKYGGFYISCYKISIRQGKLRSVKGENPIPCCAYEEAISKIDSKFANMEAHLTLGSEYDSVQEWLIQTQMLDCEQIQKAEYRVGEVFKKFKNPLEGNLWLGSAVEKLGKTGAIEGKNNVYDFITEGCEWTQESFGKYDGDKTVRCCGNCCDEYLIGYRYKLSNYGWGTPPFDFSVISYRVVFYIK